MIAKIKDSYVNLEVANTDLLRSKGLSDRDSLSKNSGMIFIFDSQDRYSFHMRNMRVALDIIFVDEDGVITKIVSALPEESNISGNAKYVVELNKDFCKNHSIAEGDRLIMNRQERIASRRIAQTGKLAPEFTEDYYKKAIHGDGSMSIGDWKSSKDRALHHDFMASGRSFQDIDQPEIKQKHRDAAEYWRSKMTGATASRKVAQVKSRLDKYDINDASVIKNVLAMIRAKRTAFTKKSDEDLWNELIRLYGGSELVALLDAIVNYLS
jgi:uncharacterized membrane protein (UPF0127 family)